MVELGGLTGMNKKLLLLVLPTLMVLSSCGRVNNVQLQKQVNAFEGIVEDNLAHEEVFGGEAIQTQAIRKLPVVGNETDYKLGYQLHFDDQGNDDPSDDLLSIRFVAALKQEYATMRWTRGASGNDGDVLQSVDDKWYDPVKMENIPLESKSFFTTLSSGGADTITAGEGDYTGFAGFIVYSMLNIPYEATKLGYIGVSLTLTPAEGDAVQTKFHVIKIGTNNTHTESLYSFSFANDKNGFFLKGKIGGVAGAEVNADDPIRGDGNFASFTTNVSLDDEFLAIKKTSTLFQVWNRSCMAGDEAATYFEDEGDFISPKTAGNYRFYLTTSNGIYVTAPASSNVGTTYFLRGGMNSWTGAATDEFKTNGDWNNTGVLLNVELEANVEFKIAKNDGWTYQWNYWGYQLNGTEYWRGYEVSNVIGGAAANFEGGSDNNIKCKVAGTYNFYLTDLNYLSVELAA